MVQAFYLVNKATPTLIHSHVHYAIHDHIRCPIHGHVVPWHTISIQKDPRATHAENMGASGPRRMSVTNVTSSGLAIMSSLR